MPQCQICQIGSSHVAKPTFGPSLCGMFPAADRGGMWQPGAAVVEGRALPGLGRIQEYHPRRGHGMPWVTSSGTHFDSD